MIRLKKSFVITITTLLTVALLTFNVGKVTRVYAIGTTTVAAAAAATFCAVGIAYCSYMLLTGAAVHIPDTVENVQNWLTDMGKKVVQYPAGRQAYEELYPQFLRENSHSLIHDFLDSEVWTWTADKLKIWANDFSSTEVMSQIAAYTYYTSTDSLYPTNGYSYTITADFPTEIYTNWYNGSITGFLENVGQFYFDTAHLVYYDYGFGHALISLTNIDATVRNLRIVDDGIYKYIPQYLDGTTWMPYGSISWRTGYIFVNGYYYDVCLFSNGDIWRWQQNSNISISSSDQRGIIMDYPLFPDAVIHDAITDTDLPMVDAPTDVQERVPEWPDIPVQDDEVEYPIVPYVQLPMDPNWVNPTGGPNGGGNWGFNLGDLLDMLEDLANTLIQIGVLADLINDFKRSLTGDPSDVYYIYYDDSTNNTDYFEYYTITNYNGDTYVYDIDVSETDKHLPVDLNTISSYTNNRYVDTFKRVADTGSSIIGDLVVFWHNVDPDIIYTLFGCAIITLIAAFIGKLGHS